ncbi:hypothetical protein ACB094_04G010900 [Castanea mollissima]
MQVSNQPRYPLMDTDSLLAACHGHHRRCYIFHIQTPSSTETHKPKKIIKPTWKRKTHKFKTNNTQMEKQTQIKPLVTRAVEQRRTLKERPCRFSMKRSSRFGHRGFADL